MFKKLRRIIENTLDKVKSFFTDEPKIETADEIVFDRATGNAVLQNHANPTREYTDKSGDIIEPKTRWKRDVKITENGKNLITKIESSLEISFVQSFLISSGILESFVAASQFYGETLVKVSFETREFFVDNHLYLVRLNKRQTAAGYLPQLSAIVLGEYKKFSVTPSGKASYRIQSMTMEFIYKGRASDS